MELAQAGGHNDWVTSLAFSPDDAKLATASWDRTIRIWDVIRSDVSLPARTAIETRANFGKHATKLSWNDVLRVIGTGEAIEVAERQGHRYALDSGRFMAVEGADSITILFPADEESLAKGAAFLSSDLFTISEQSKLLELLGGRRPSEQAAGRFRVTLGVMDAAARRTWLPSDWIHLKIRSVALPENGIEPLRMARESLDFEGLLDHPKYREMNRYVNDLLKSHVQRDQLEKDIRILNMGADQAGYSAGHAMAFLKRGLDEGRRMGLPPGTAVQATSESLYTRVALDASNLQAWLGSGAGGRK